VQCHAEIRREDCTQGTAQVHGGRVSWLGGLFPLLVLVGVWWIFGKVYNATMGSPKDDD
jgi:hypothetical protein